MPATTSFQPLYNRLSLRRLIVPGVIALFLAAIASTGLQQDEGSGTHSPPNNRGLMSGLRPSSTATALTWQVFSASGELDYEVSAAQLEQYPSQQLMNVISPVVHLTSPDQLPWVISADRGVITHLRNAPNADAENNQMTLQGRVQILRQDGAAQTQLRLSTTQLHVFPLERRAQTDTAVLLQHDRFTTSSEGLDLNLKTGTVVFAQNTGGRVTSKLLLRD
ncbi:MAG: LPS export ABC transporter periplasmic protein LptC [Gammaproteobacteria bacterium]|nr:LPS export ABC transporter periplasmic protein LptC [Gammaproteobacteria bacterium]